MRNTSFLLPAVAVVSFLVGPPDLPGDSKEEQERSEKQEKQLTEWERAHEKEAWAVRRQQSIVALAKELQKAGRVEVFRLSPRPLPEKDRKEKRTFHDYEVLFAGPAETAERRKAMASFVGRTLHWNEFRQAACFRPRHGVRFVCGGQTWDFVLCFECSRTDIFEGEELRSSFALLRPKDNPIEQFLRDLEKKAKGRQ